MWDEAVKINGADPDFHRRDLWEAIEHGDFPEWELGLQLFDDEVAASLDFDVLDATKIIPEEIIPLRMVGRMVLNRNVDNFFAETEQVAFLPTNVPPGIEFTNDPLLQGRLFSYQDTQLSRLGGPNFHQIPVNAPRCPFHNFQRDGLRQMEVPKGRVNYEPNSFDTAPRENPTRGFTSVPEQLEGVKIRKRSETFSDHYSQARQFYRSMTPTEQTHIVSAFAFELSHVVTKAIRARVVGHLALVDASLHERVVDALGIKDPGEKITPAIQPRDDLKPSPALSILGKAPVTLAGRKIGVLVTDGFDAKLLAGLRSKAKANKAMLAVIAPKVGGATDSTGALVEADFPITAGPSIFFDAVAILASEAGAQDLSTQAVALDWVANAYAHLKVIAFTPGTQVLLEMAGVKPDDGVIQIASEKAVASFINTAKNGRVWDREPTLRRPG